MNKSFMFAVSIMTVAVFSGCATGTKNDSYRPEIDSLNSRVSSLQGNLSAKDQEIADLQSQINDGKSQLAQADADRRLLEEKLEKERLAALTAPAPEKPKYDSDLK